MKTITTFTTICTLSLFLVSCSKKIKYEAPIFPNQESLNVEIINDDFIFRAISFLSVYDSLLIVCDPSQSPVANVFNKNDGNFIGSFGNKGQGPGELVQPYYFSFDQKNGHLYVHDSGRKLAVSFDLNFIGTSGNVPFQEIRFNNNEPILNYSYFLRDSLFLFDIGRRGIALGTTNQIFDNVMPEHPGFSNNKDFGWRHFVASNSTMAINPAGNRFVIGTRAGCILYIYSADELQINLESTKYFYKPIFTRNGPAYDTSGSEFGFAHLYLSNQYIYGNIFEQSKGLPQSISKFDYSGNPVAQYNFDYPIFHMAVDENDQYIYMAVYKDGELALGKASLP
jgi:hypothetical protein